MAKSGLRHIDVGPELTKTEWESEESHELIHGTSFPGTPVERQLFYRDDEHKWYIYNGTAWVSLQGGGGMEIHGNEYHDPDFATEAALAAHAGAADPHTVYVKHALATAVSDFLVASGVGVFVKKTLAEVKAILNWAADIATHAALSASHGRTNIDGVTERDSAISTHAALTGTHGQATIEGIAGSQAKVDTHAAVAAPHSGHINHSLATAISDFLVASGAGVFIKKTLAEVRTLLNWAADIATHAGLTTGTHGVGAGTIAKVGDIAVDANLSAAGQDAIAKKHTQGTDVALGAVGTKNPPIDADKALYRDSAASDALKTSTWTQVKAFLKTYFDTVYRLATADHTHQSTGAQAGKLDHGLALNGLADDDHPQYIKHSLATAVSDFIVASGAGVFIKKTLAEVRTSLNWAADIATHAALKTGVHGVGANYIAKSSVDGLNVASHVPRHRKAGGDSLSPFCLPDLIGQSNFMMIPTAAGWTVVLTGASNVRQEPMRNMVEITDTALGSALAHAAAFGFNIGGNYGRINWGKNLYIIFNYAIYRTEADLTRRVQIKQATALGQLAEIGLGFQVVNLVMTGESYGTARGTVALGNMVEIATPAYETIQVIIEIDPDTPAVNFYIDGSLVDSITNTDHIPSGLATGACYLVHSIDRPDVGAAGVASIFLQGKIWQEL